LEPRIPIASDDGGSPPRVGFRRRGAEAAKREARCVVRNDAAAAFKAGDIVKQVAPSGRIGGAAPTSLRPRKILRASREALQLAKR